MKKIFAMAAALLLSASMMSAQNTFKGIVKYKVESTGQVAMTIPEEAATAEIRVSGDDMFTKSAIFMSSPFSECILVQNLTMTRCENYGMLLSYLRSQGSEFDYQGDGKLIIKNTAKADAFDSLEIVDKEPGHFSIKSVGKTFLGAWPALLMPIIIIGTITTGIVSPTEAGAIAVVDSVRDLEQYLLT